jgi:hypothetical protein
MEFRQSIDLFEGPNLITVKARDLTGKETEKTVHITVDRQGPLVSVEHVSAEQRNEGIIGIRCSLADETGLSSLSLQDKKFEFKGSKEIAIDEKVILKPGEDRIPFEVKDLAGNVTAGEISLSSPPLQSLNPVIHVASLEDRIKDIGEGLFSKDKGVPPLTIRLKDLTERQTVYYETI